MGKLIAIHPKNILATNDSLKPELIAQIMNFFDNANSKLPSAPIVIKKDGNYVALDGHNLLATCHYLDISCDVYLMEGSEEVSWANFDKSRLNLKKTYPFDYVLNNNIDLFE